MNIWKIAKNTKKYKNIRKIIKEIQKAFIKKYRKFKSNKKILQNKFDNLLEIT